MAIKNYTTKVPAVHTVGEIQGILAAHGARKVMMDYDEQGKVEAVTFALFVGDQLQGFRLVSNPAGAMSAMAKAGVKCTAEQAEKIAWRNIKDWIDAQIALVEIEQASMDELFLPMMVNDKQETLYQMFSKNRLMLE